MRSDIVRIAEPSDWILIKHFLHEVNRFSREVSWEFEGRLVHDILVHFNSVLVVMWR